MRTDLLESDLFLARRRATESTDKLATGAKAGGRTAPAGRWEGSLTRDWGLLVQDQDILDLIATQTRKTVWHLAAEFLAIQDAIEANDLESIKKTTKTKSPPYQKVLSAIKGGLAAGDIWSARHTAEAVVQEAFRYTVPYVRALEAFRVSLRRMRTRNRRPRQG